MRKQTTGLVVKRTPLPLPPPHQTMADAESNTPAASADATTVPAPSTATATTATTATTTTATPPVPAPSAPATEEEPQPLFAGAGGGAKPKKPRAPKGEPKGTKAATKPKAPKKAKEPTRHASDDEAEEDAEGDDEDDDAKEAARENKDADILVEKQRILAQIAAWKAAGEVKRVKALTHKSSLDAIADEYYRIKEVLGLPDTDGEDEIVPDEDAEDEEAEREASEKARMLAALREWWEAGRVPKPRKRISETSDFEDVQAAYERAAAKLGVSTDDAELMRAEGEAFGRQQEATAARKQQRERMLAQLTTWWRDGTLEQPARPVTALSSYDTVLEAFQEACGAAGVDAETVLEAVTAVGRPAEPTVIGGRSLRNRETRKTVVDTYRARFVDPVERELEDATTKRNLLTDLRAWVKEGLYADDAEDAVSLKVLSRKTTPLAAVQAEYDRVCAALGLDGESEEDDADEDDAEEDEDEDGDAEEEGSGDGDDDDSSFHSADASSPSPPRGGRKRLRKVSSASTSSSHDDDDSACPGSDAEDCDTAEAPPRKRARRASNVIEDGGSEDSEGSEDSGGEGEGSDSESSSGSESGTESADESDAS